MTTYSILANAWAEHRNLTALQVGYHMGLQSEIKGGENECTYALV
jgi:hypothetical protein